MQKNTFMKILNMNYIKQLDLYFLKNVFDFIKI